MLTDEEIYEIGTALEHGGMSDEDIDTYLEHHGVRGMKWGQRKSGPGSKAAQKIGKSVKDNHPKVAKGAATAAMVVGKTASGTAKTLKFAAQHRKAIAGAAAVGLILASQKDRRLSSLHPRTRVPSTHTIVREITSGR